MGEVKEIMTTVHLDFPVTVEVDGVEQVFSELTLHKIRMRDTLVTEGETSPALAGLKLFASMARVSVDVMLELDRDDFVKVSDAAGPLMGKSGPPTQTEESAEA